MAMYTVITVDVILHNEAIRRVTKAKFLGVIVDQHLSWRDLISMVSHKISKSSGIISRIRNTLDIKSKKFIYYSFIHSYLTYCINVWYSTYRTYLKTLCTAQKRSVYEYTLCYCSAAPFERYHQSKKLASGSTD